MSLSLSLSLSLSWLLQISILTKAITRYTKLNS